MKLKKTTPQRDYFSTLEQVAKLLLKRMIPFHYCSQVIDIKHQGVVDDTLVSSVSYDSETGEVVLMADAYQNYLEVRHSDFAAYLNAAK